jgi:Histidine kinase-, DNA gyrase B-, and HSP90-like ATPase
VSEARRDDRHDLAHSFRLAGEAVPSARTNNRHDPGSREVVLLTPYNLATVMLPRVAEWSPELRLRPPRRDDGHLTTRLSPPRQEKAMTTRAMQVANIAFLLDRLAADTPPNQQIRELTENAIEAIERRQKAGDPSEGVIRWDVDWDNLKRTNQYKLSIVDNGDGMTSQQMLEYLNALAVQGANQTQHISQNFGVGAKITALHRNSHGLVYQSWHDGKGAMVKLHRDDKAGAIRSCLVRACRWTGLDTAD